MKFKIAPPGQNCPLKTQTNFENNTFKHCSAVFFFMSMTEIEGSTQTEQIGIFTLHEKVKLQQTMDLIATVSSITHHIMLSKVYENVEREPALNIFLPDLFPAELVKQPNFIKAVSNAINTVDNVLNDNEKIITFLDYRKPNRVINSTGNPDDSNAFKNYCAEHNRLFHPASEAWGERKWISHNGSGSGHSISIEEDIFAAGISMERRAYKIYCKLMYSINTAIYTPIILESAQYIFNHIAYLRRKKIHQEIKNDSIQKMNEIISQREYEEAINNPIKCTIL